jgi:hypothetical protein
MSKNNDLATIQLLNNINEKKKSNLSENKNKKKDISNEKDNCTAAVRYNTIGNAYKDRMSGVEVYLIKEEKNGNMKTHAYSRCSKTTQEGTNFCHLHCRMTKYNNDGLKIFEKDILPSIPNDKTRWLANVNDDFFENMGKRGAKKKNGENNYTFPDENHPVLLILNHKNAKLATQLSIVASQLLKNSNYVCQDINKKTIPKKEIIEDSNIPNINNLISMISAIDKPFEEDSKSESSEEDVVESDEEDIVEPEEEVVESESDEEDEEGVSCIPIYTNKKKLLWYNQDNQIVYEPEGDDGGEEIGILKEISEEYHTINYEGKLCTVLKEINNIKNKGKLYCCVLTNSLFDKELNFIGTRNKIKNNEYNFDFTK